jgi:hypothetical protein
VLPRSRFFSRITHRSTKKIVVEFSDNSKNGLSLLA